MKTLQKSLLILAVALGTVQAAAQELNCTVEVNSDQVSGQRTVFETLEQAISDYMNTTVFTNAQFSPNQSLRPVYNSSYTTTLINFKDTRIDFTYRENEPLVYSVNNMESQLTAILNYYAFLILAVDFDSFAPKGGESYYERLKQIVQMAQSSGEVGWKAFEDTKNRSAVLNGFVEPQTADIRDLLYKYHRLGLDQMATSVDRGRANVTESLDEIAKIYSNAPMSVMISMFKDAKMDELVNIYSKAPAEERNKVYELLQPVYSAEQERLEKIKRGQEDR